MTAVYDMDAMLARDRFLAGPTATDPIAATAARCRARWQALANALCHLPRPVEGALVVEAADGQLRVRVVDLSDGAGHGGLRPLLERHLDYGRWRAAEEPDWLGQPGAVMEILRREDVVRDTGARRVVGFGATADTDDDQALCHLRPWLRPEDPWEVLCAALLAAGDRRPALVVRFRAVAHAPATCVARATRRAAAWRDAAGRPDGSRLESGLRRAAVQREAIVGGPVVAARVFVVAAAADVDDLVADVAGCLGRTGADDTEALWSGGVEVRRGRRQDLTRSLAHPQLRWLFSPEEAATVLRTPMPPEEPFPGITLLRARTAVLDGRAGDDAALGSNRHRGRSSEVALDGPGRFRHTYVIGQTGTGKSTLLQHMILHDIEAGRGVCVLDPHGPLVSDVLARIPRHREQDVVLLDVTDIEHPVPFNVLRVKEPDPIRYRLSRDLVIDDLHGYVKRNFHAETMGPMFETHMRAMLGLLLGVGEPTPPAIPNLMHFPRLYNDKRFRKRLLDRMSGQDPVIEDFIRMVDDATHDTSYRGMSGYVTSKFNRFVSDFALRNITCQNEVLDFDALVEDGRVVLVYLGKGRFGDVPAGLLASQVMSRIRSAVMRRGAGEDQRPFYVYADEFQLFADDRIGELLAEARKFKLSLTLAHQYTRQLPPSVLHAVLGNVGTVVGFRVGAPDAEALAPTFAPMFDGRDLCQLPNHHAYVRSHGPLGDVPFSLATRAPSATTDPAAPARIRDRCRQTVARRRAEVEIECRQALNAFSCA